MSELLQKEFRQVWRSFRLPALYLALLFLAITDPLTTKYMGEILQMVGGGITVIFPPPTAEMALGSFVGDVAEIGLIVIVAITMGAVAGEKASGVTAFIVTKPVSRKSYVAAKYLTLALGILLGIAGSMLVAYLYAWTLMGPLPIYRVLMSSIAAALYAELVMSATFAASMAFSGPLAAGGAGLVFLIISGIAGSLFKNTATGAWFPSTLVGNASLLLSSGGQGAAFSTISLLVEPGTTAMVICAVLLWAGFARFGREPLQ